MDECRKEWAKRLEEAGRRYQEAIEVYRREPTTENGRRVNLAGIFLDGESERIGDEMKGVW